MGNKKAFRNTVLFSFLLLFVALSFAQETADTLTFNTTLTLGGQRRAGVFSQTIVNGSWVTNLSKRNWSVMNTSSYVHTTVNGNPLSNDWTLFSTFMYHFANQEQLSPSFFHVYKNNLLYRINHSQRYLLGLTIIPIKARKEFWFFLGGGYEHTQYNGEVFANSPLVDPIRSFGMTAFYVENAHHLIQDKLYLKYSLFYIQSFQESSDFTIWIIPSLNIQLNQHLTFAINYDLRFRNVHLADIPNFNELLTFNVRVSLGS